MFRRAEGSEENTSVEDICIMKRLLAMLLCVGLCMVLGLGTTGCGKKTEKDKVAADKDKDKDKDKGKVKENTVAVSSPAAATTIKPGEKKIVDLTLTRGKDATKEVTFKIDVDPKDKGVSASAEKTAKNEAKLTIEAADTAKGDFTITVTPSGEGIDAKAGKVMVKVAAEAAAKDTSLSVKGAEVTVKQGEKGTATVSAKLGKDLTGADLKVDLKDAKEKAVDEKDVKVELAPAKLKESGDAKVNITVGEKAAPGEYTATVTATAEGATAATAKVAIKVEEKKK
jgi:uncharacterized membrane protein